MITVKIIGDSVNPAGVRLTSAILTYPRFIHSELMTHRAFSRNAASSRAIPFPKMLEAVDELNFARPEYWGAEQKGMQSGGELEGRFTRDQGYYYEADGGTPMMECESIWQAAKNDAASYAKELHDEGLHKSLCNRLIEPFAHMTTLVTASQWGWENFFALRAHPAAQPEFQVLAYRMLQAYVGTIPQKLEWGQWHIPKFNETEVSSGWDTTANMLKVATARCARLSYLTFDGTHSTEKDIELHDQLAQNGHWSPFEHCAQAVKTSLYDHSNFDCGSLDSHFKQYRKEFPAENRINLDLHTILDTKPAWIQP